MTGYNYFEKASSPVALGFILPLTLCAALYSVVPDRMQHINYSKGRQRFVSLINSPIDKYRLPDVILAGVRKCGTRFLHDSLALHPGVTTSCRYECHFFDDLWFTGWGGYHNLVNPRRSAPVPDDTLLLEKTPAYFHTLGVPQAISAMGAIVILILCNPVERVLSNALVNPEKDGSEFITREVLNVSGQVNPQALSVVPSLYATMIPEWLDHFEVNSTLLFVDGESMRHRPWEELERVQDFLGLPHKVTKESFYYNSTKGFYCLKEGPSLGYAKKHRCMIGKGRKEKMSYFKPELVEKLKTFFRPSYQEIYRMVGNDLGWN